MCTTLSASRAARTIPSASAPVRASGFSQSTCLPPLSAEMAMGACKWFGAPMLTTSRSALATRSSQLL
jgi:hypothetical protein